MPILKKDVPASILPPTRTVSVPELGGEVVVRPLRLSQRLELSARDAQANGDARHQYDHVSALLAYSVVDRNGEPIYSAEEWEVFGAQYLASVLKLWQEVYAVSGLNQDEAEKNPTPGPQARDDAGAKTRPDARGTGRNDERA